MNSPLLHIVARATDTSDHFNLRLQDQGIVSLTVEDCYAALAALVRREPAGIQAVLVSMDGLQIADREFFFLASRRFREIPVFVYGENPMEFSCDAAVTCGARAIVDAHTLSDYLPAARIDRSRSQPSVAPRRDDDGATPARATDTAQSTPGPSAGSSPPNPFEAGVARTQRGQQPLENEARISAALDADTSSTAAREVNAPIETRALLSDAELQALLGDDEDTAEATPETHPETP